MSLPKFHYQPLGTTTDLQKIIESFPAEQFHEETRNLTIIYAKRKLQVQIPLHWTVNKVKCMMLIHFQTLNFDKFEFQCNKFLIPGKTTVAQLPSQQLIVTQAECPNSFEKYYKESMKKVVKKYEISTQNSLYPITHRSLSQAMIENIPIQRLGNIQQITENRRRQEPQGMMIINILRIIGIAFMSNLIFTFASFGQIAVLVGVALVYYLIDEYVKYNDRKRREQQRRNEQQQANRKKQEVNKPKTNQKIKIQEKQQSKQKPQSIQEQEFSVQKSRPEENQINEGNREFIQKASIKDENLKLNKTLKAQRKVIKAKVIFWTAFLAQFFYCYILSVFPNWTVETHLHANQEKINQIMDKIKKLDPEASQMIKKWEIKGNTKDQKINNQFKKMKQQ